MKHYPEDTHELNHRSYHIKISQSVPLALDVNQSTAAIPAVWFLRTDKRLQFEVWLSILLLFHHEVQTAKSVCLFTTVYVLSQRVCPFQSDCPFQHVCCDVVSSHQVRLLYDLAEDQLTREIKQKEEQERSAKQGYRCSPPI